MDKSFVTAPPNLASPRTAPPKIAHTISEAVLASGLSRSTIYVLIGRGELKARKCGARTLILKSDLQRFLTHLPSVAKAKAPSDTEEPKTEFTKGLARRDGTQ